MKKLRLLLMFVLIAATVVLTSSCVDLSAYGITIPGLTQTCTVHRDINKDTICDVCGSTVPVNCTNHVDLDHDGVCDTNGCSASLSVFHYDEDHDGNCDEELCTKTGMKVTHVDDNMDRKCDECGKKIDLDCECFDEDEDGYCDECGYEILPCEHVDEDGDGECDECGEEVKEPCDECVDANKDGKCDECGNKVEAAPSCDHEDANFDGKCDSCKEKMDGVIPIYENGKFNYTIVFSSGLPGDQAMVIDQLISQLKGFGLTVPAKGEDKAAKETEYEIIFGTPSERDDIYKIDGHDYGMKGYSVQLVGKKIIVVWRSDNTFSDAVAALKESFLGIASNTRKLTTRYVSE